MTATQKLKVFLCHASQDKPEVRNLYHKLLAETWIDPWLDEEKLLPGQDWNLEIEKAVEASDAVIVCLSGLSVTKEGYVQKEIRKVLDIALEKPEDTIFIIPLRLEDCELPRRLRTWHYVDYFPTDHKERGYQRLLQALNLRSGQLGSPKNQTIVPVAVSIPPPEQIAEGAKQNGDKIAAGSGKLVKASESGVAGMGLSVFLLLYFAMAAVDSFVASSDVQETLLAVSAILAGTTLLLKRQLPAGWIFKIALTVYLLIYGFGYRLSDPVPIAPLVGGIAAVLAGIVVILSVKLEKKPAFYASIAFVVFLFLVAVYELVTNIGYTSFTNTLDALIFLTSIIASTLLWIDL